VNDLSDSSVGVFVSPLEGESCFVVMADIGHDLSVEVGLGFEDAACNEVSLDLGEPDLDLIEPRGIGRGEMELDVGTDAQKLLNGFSFMSRKVVGDDMNMGFGGLSSDHLGEELHELGAGVTVSCLSQDLAGGRIQGRIERKSAVAKVFESVTFGPARRERQDGIETIKGLNGALFIDTENSRMGRRLQVETDDCGRLLLKLRVIADHVVATPVRLQPCLSPHPGHTHMVNAERGPQLAAAPMGGTIGGLAVQSPIDDPSFEFLDAFTGGTSTVPTPESGQTLFFKAVPPHSHRIDTATLLPADSPKTQRTRSQPQDNPRTASVLSAPTAATTHGLKLTAFRGTQNDSIGHASKHSTAIS